MKKVLFVIKNMNLGGPATSLLNMLEMLKEKGYTADLFLMEHTGIFMERAKKAANLLPEDKALATLLCDVGRVKKDYGIRGLFYRGVFSFLKKKTGQKTLINKVFEYCAKKLKGYDVTAVYQENISTDFAKFIPSPEKVAWVHTIYERFTKNYTDDEVYNIYKDFDEIICVIGAGAEAFKKGQPKLSDRVRVINNPLNAEDIMRKGKEEASLSDCFKIVSIGRLSAEKQYEYCIEAAERLKNDGHSFKWYIIGEGQERQKLERLVKDGGLADFVELKGAMANPYSILAKCDLLVISSAYEAQPMVANEAFISGVPVVSTAFDSAYEFIKDGQNGLICNNSSVALYEAIGKLMSDKELMERIKSHAKAFEYDNNLILRQTIKVLYGEENE